MPTQQAIQPVDGGSSPTSPLQFTIKEVKAKLACEYNALWHSRLPYIHWSNVVRNTHYVCYGAYVREVCMAVGIWSSPVAQNRFAEGKKMLELRRMAISEKCPPNTASRMLSVMVKQIKKKFPEITRLISYQDTDVHRGTIYKASGWQPAAETKFVSWSATGRKRSKDQATGGKIRWELQLATHNPRRSIFDD